MKLLEECQLKVCKLNPRQYAAEIPNVPGMEVWFQRATDVVRKLLSGDIDVGIVGYDMLREIGCLLYTSPSPRDRTRARMPSSA